MIIRNIGSKVISIGSAVLMPDGEIEVTDAIANAASIKAMCEKGFISVERARKTGRPPKTAAKSSIEKPQPTDSANKTAAESGTPSNTGAQAK